VKHSCRSHLCFVGLNVTESSLAFVTCLRTCPLPPPLTPALIELLKEHGVFYQAYSVMNAFLPQFHMDNFPRGSPEWERVTSAVFAVSGFGDALESEGFPHMSESELLIAYLTANGVGIIPRSGNHAHIASNAKAAGALDALPADRLEDLGHLLDEWLRATHKQPKQSPHTGDEDL
jgi:diketogulonate reductase-like aldo/keto reductase